MLSDKAKIRVSKYMSFVLRHDPAAGGLTLDVEGWVSLGNLLVSVQQNVDKTVTLADVLEVVQSNDKQRFALRDDSPAGQMIRANQGHSTEVDLKLADAVPPSALYHGTSTNVKAAILKDGLLKMGRHAVHLSVDIETARKVGQRQRGDLIIFCIAAKKMSEAGYKFQMSDNGVWLTDFVPREYLCVQERI